MSKYAPNHARIHFNTSPTHIQALLNETYRTSVSHDALATVLKHTKVCFAASPNPRYIKYVASFITLATVRREQRTSAAVTAEGAALEVVASRPIDAYIDPSVVGSLEQPRATSILWVWVVDKLAGWSAWLWTSTDMIAFIHTYYRDLLQSVTMAHQTNYFDVEQNIKL